MRSVKRLLSLLVLMVGVLLATAVAHIAAQDNPTPPPPDTGLDSGKPVLTLSGDPYEQVIADQPAQPEVAPASVTAAPTITVWHEADIAFRGNPQTWLNILGNISGVGPTNVELTYRLNNTGNFIPLSLGPDKRRLAQNGDFNIELPYNALNNGSNSVEIRAKNINSNEEATKTITFNYSAGFNWPKTYTADWGSANDIYDVAHVVDGQWTIEAGGTLRPLDVATGTTPVLDYDRLVAMGDSSWTDYEATVPITIHAIDDPDGFKAPSYGPGIGLIMRWNGHYQEVSEQPRVGWHKLGALAWYRWAKDGNGNISAGMQLLGYSYDGVINYPSGGNVLMENPNVQLNYGQEYMLKMQAQSTGAESTIYRMRVWRANQTEPTDWQLVGEVNDPDAPTSGSLLLVAHHVDVSFGDVSVKPLTAVRYTLTTNSSSGGSVQASPDLADYAAGQEVELTANATPGYQFTGWTGDLTGNQNPATVVMDSNKSITATFSQANTPVSDDFNNCTLSPIWTFVNPGSDGSAIANGTQLELFVPGGSAHDLYPGSNKNAIRVMQYAANGDFTAVVKFDSVLDPANKYQMQGLLVQQDNNNFIRFDFYSDGSKLNVYYVAVKNNVVTQQESKVLSNNMSFMRIKRVGNEWTQEYSSNGSSWQTNTATFTEVLAVSQVGIFGGNQTSNKAHTVLADYFFNAESPIANEDALGLTINKTGQGSVKVTPATYKCGQTVTLEALPKAGWLFTNWSGDITGSQNPRSFTYEVGMEITAVFRKADFNLYLPVIQRN